MSKKFLISGASGFIGREVVASNSHNSIGIYREFNVEHPDGITISNINASTNWTGAFDGIEAVIHLAGIVHKPSIDIELYHEVNTLGTWRFAKEAAKAGVKRFVYVSSILVNGVSTDQTPISESSKFSPHNAYAKSKSDAEIGLKKLSDETGIEVVIVRPALVYGKNAPGNFGALTRLINKCLFLPFALAKNRRDFIAIQNLADLLITCANHPDAAGHTFLASDGETVSIKGFTNAIAKGLNKKLIQIPVPISLMCLTARLVGKHAMAEQLLGNLQVDSSNAHEVLGWVPPYTMEQAMASLSENK